MNTGLLLIYHFILSAVRQGFKALVKEQWEVWYSRPVFLLRICYTSLADTDVFRSSAYTLTQRENERFTVHPNHLQLLHHTQLYLRLTNSQRIATPNFDFTMQFYQVYLPCLHFEDYFKWALDFLKMYMQIDMIHRIDI